MKKYTKYSEDAAEFQLAGDGLQKSILGTDKRRLLPAKTRFATLTPGFTHTTKNITHFGAPLCTRTMPLHRTEEHIKTD
jgi:hypothetical protein